MWGNLRLCGGEDVDQKVSLYHMKGTHGYFGRAPQSKLSKDAEVTEALRNGTIDFCVLEPAYISVNHFLIKRVQENTYNKEVIAYSLVDLSTNGTYVDARLVGKQKEVPLEDGSKISIKFK